MLFGDLLYCAWCGVEKVWWRILLMRIWCRDCADPRSSYVFHSRVGMKER